MIREALLVSLTMSMVILGFIGLSLVFPNKVSPKIRYRIWTVVMLGLLIPIRPTIGGGIISLDPFLPEEPIGEILPIIPINPSPSPVQTLPGTTPSFSWETALFWVWVLGTAGTLAYHAVQYIRFQRSVKRWSEPEDDLQALEIFNQVKMDLGIKQNIDLVVCSFVSGCMLSGFLRPIILLPEKNFTDEELELIFIHELTHFRRRDLWVKLLSMIAVAIHWFNPLAYVMGGFLQAEGEASCDLEVIERKGPGEKYFYAEVIIGMIGHKTPGLSAMTTHFYGGKRGIKRRLESLMESTPAKSAFSHGILVLVFAATMLSGNLFAASSSRPPLPIDEQIGSDLALEAVGGGQVVEIQRMDGNIYHIHVTHNGDLYHVNVDVKNQQVLALSINRETEDGPLPTNEGENSINPGAVSEITREQAANIALASFDGTLILVDADMEMNRRVWYVAIQRGGMVYEVYVDMISGEIIYWESYED